MPGRRKAKQSFLAFLNRLAREDTSNVKKVSKQKAQSRNAKQTTQHVSSQLAVSEHCSNDDNAYTHSWQSEQVINRLFPPLPLQPISNGFLDFGASSRNFSNFASSNFHMETQAILPKGKKRPYIGDNGQETLQTNKRSKFSEFNVDERLWLPPSRNNNEIQTRSTLDGEGQASLVTPCINRGRKRQHNSDENGCPFSKSGQGPYMVKKRQLSTTMMYQMDTIGKCQMANDDHVNIAQNQSKKEPVYKLAIVTDDYPTTMFKWEQYDAIQMAIFEKLETMPDPLPVVNLGLINNLGAIPVSCHGKQSADFLRTFDGQVIQKSFKLKIVEAANLPKPVKMVWRTRNVVCKDTDRVLRMLQRCNPNLRTALWRVLETHLDAQGVRRIILVDCISAAHIKSRNYSIPDGLNRSIFKVLEAPKTKSLSSGINGCETEHRSSQVITVTTVGSGVKPQIPLDHRQEMARNESLELLELPDTDSSVWEIREPDIIVDLTDD